MLLYHFSAGFKGTRVFSSLQYFVTEMALGDLSVAAKQFQRKAEAVFFTPKEKDDYNKLIYFNILCFISFLLFSKGLLCRMYAYLPFCSPLEQWFSKFSGPRTTLLK